MSKLTSIAEIGDVQDICNRVAQHSRGVDRADEGLLADCYHEDGTVDYRFFNGPANVFATILTGAQRGQPVTHHRTCQMWVETNGDEARSESYVMAYAQSPEADGASYQRIICGRYLDRHERRSGQWRLVHRTYVLDTNANWPGAFDIPILPSLATHVPTGGQGTQDAGTALLAVANLSYSSRRRRGLRQLDLTLCACREARFCVAPGATRFCRVWPGCG